MLAFAHSVYMQSRRLSLSKNFDISKTCNVLMLDEEEKDEEEVEEEEEEEEEEED